MIMESFFGQIEDIYSNVFPETVASCVHDSGQYTNIRDLFLHRDRSCFFHYYRRAVVTRTDYVIDSY